MSMLSLQKDSENTGIKNYHIHLAKQSRKSNKRKGMNSNLDITNNNFYQTTGFGNLMDVTKTNLNTTVYKNNDSNLVQQYEKNALDQDEKRPQTTAT